MQKSHNSTITETKKEANQNLNYLDHKLDSQLNTTSNEIGITHIKFFKESSKLKQYIKLILDVVNINLFTIHNDNTCFAYIHFLTALFTIYSIENSLC